MRDIPLIAGEDQVLPGDAASASDESATHEIRRPTPGTAEAAQPAAKPLPDSLSLKNEQYREALRAELAPSTALESIFVDEMARHAAALEFSGAAEGRVLRFGARCQELLPRHTSPDEEAELEAMFAAALTNNAVERTERFGQNHRRGFYKAYAQLQALRGDVVAEEGLATAFDREGACEMYLVGRMHAHPQRCPLCNKRKHHYLRSRRRWECAGCGAQFGLKAGTVMERSPLPLTVWFAAILTVCAAPGIASRELAEQIGVRRLATVRNMLRAILDAIASPDAETLLAGSTALIAPPDLQQAAAVFAIRPRPAKIAGKWAASRKARRHKTLTGMKTCDPTPERACVRRSATGRSGEILREELR
jgi:transposase-like protein